MSSQEEIDALHEAKIATLVKPYQKVGINTESCTLKGVLRCLIRPKEFEKMHKFLHHLVRQEIFPQLMTRAREKGIISSASSLNPAEINDSNIWIRTKEVGAVIQKEFDIRKLERKAAKWLHKETCSSGDPAERKVDDASHNAVNKRARILESDSTSS